MVSKDHCKRSRNGISRSKTQKPEKPIMSDSQYTCTIEEIAINLIKAN
jgi:hypothetical protein